MSRRQAKGLVEFRTVEISDDGPFAADEHFDAGTKITVDPYCINAIFELPSGQVFIDCGQIASIALSDVSRVRRAMIESDPGVLDFDELQDQLEVAERQHTRLLAEVARRSQ